MRSFSRIWCWFSRAVGLDMKSFWLSPWPSLLYICKTAGPDFSLPLLPRERILLRNRNPATLSKLDCLIVVSICSTVTVKSKEHLQRNHKCCWLLHRLPQIVGSPYSVLALACNYLYLCLTVHTCVLWNVYPVPCASSNSSNSYSGSSIR